MKRDSSTSLSASASNTTLTGPPPVERVPTFRPPRNTWQLLIDPTFGRYFAGKMLSTAGMWIHNVVAAILAFQISGSALMVGIVSVAQFGPQLLFAPLSGAMADRGNRRRQVVLGRLIVAFGSGSLALMLALGGVEGLPGVWPVILAAGIVGIGFVIGGPAMQALIPSYVQRAELPTAVALNSIPFTIARAGGPALGAFIAVAAGPATAFMLAALGNLLFALMIPRPIRHEPRRADRDRSVGAGIRYLGQDRGIILLLLGVTAIGIAADPVVTLTPALSTELGRGTTMVGLFASAFGIGAGLAFPLLSLLRSRLGLARQGALGLSTMAAGLLLTGALPFMPVILGGLVIGGAGLTMSLTSLSTQLQQRVPDDLRGRVMALWSVAFLGSRPLAAAFNGAVSDLTSARFTFAVVGVLVFVLAWFGRPSRVAARPVPQSDTHAVDADTGYAPRGATAA